MEHSHGVHLPGATSFLPTSQAHWTVSATSTGREPQPSEVGRCPRSVIALPYFSRVERGDFHPVSSRCPEVGTGWGSVCAVWACGDVNKGHWWVFVSNERKSFLQLQRFWLQMAWGLFVYLSERSNGQCRCLKIARFVLFFAYLALLGTITLQHPLQRWFRQSISVRLNQSAPRLGNGNGERRRFPWSLGTSWGAKKEAQSWDSGSPLRVCSCQSREGFSWKGA